MTETAARLKAYDRAAIDLAITANVWWDMLAGDDPDERAMALKHIAPIRETFKAANDDLKANAA